VDKLVVFVLWGKWGKFVFLMLGWMRGKQDAWNVFNVS